MFGDSCFYVFFIRFSCVIVGLYLLRLGFLLVTVCLLDLVKTFIELLNVLS